MTTFRQMKMNFYCVGAFGWTDKPLGGIEVNVGVGLFDRRVT